MPGVRAVAVSTHSQCLRGAQEDFIRQTALQISDCKHSSRTTADSAEYLGSMRLRQHTSDRGVSSWRVLPPGWDKNFDVGVSSFPKPVHSQLDSPAREDFFIPMATMGKQRICTHTERVSNEGFPLGIPWIAVSKSEGIRQIYILKI